MALFFYPSGHDLFYCRFHRLSVLSEIPTQVRGMGRIISVDFLGTWCPDPCLRSIARSNESALLFLPIDHRLHDPGLVCRLPTFPGGSAGRGAVLSLLFDPFSRFGTDGTAGALRAASSSFIYPGMHLDDAWAFVPLLSIYRSSYGSFPGRSLPKEKKRRGPF